MTSSCRISEFSSELSKPFQNPDRFLLNDPVIKVKFFQKLQRGHLLLHFTLKPSESLVLPIKIRKIISFVPNGADGNTKDILSTSLNPRFLPFEFNLA